MTESNDSFVVIKIKELKDLEVLFDFSKLEEGIISANYDNEKLLELGLDYSDEEVEEILQNFVNAALTSFSDFAKEEDLVEDAEV
jgi:hypothetical protein